MLKVGDQDEDENGYITLDRLCSLIAKIRRKLSYDLIQRHSRHQDLETMLNVLNRSKNTYRNGVKVSLIKSGLIDLKNEFEQISSDEKKKKKKISKQIK